MGFKRLDLVDWFYGMLPESQIKSNQIRPVKPKTKKKKKKAEPELQKTNVIIHPS